MKPVSITFALLLACAPAWAAPYVDIEKRLTPEQLQSVGLSAGQLARLDALLRAADASAPDARETGRAPAGPTRAMGLDVEPFTATVRGRIAGWVPDTEFELSNGQRWKVLKGRMVLPVPMESPQVRLLPGLAGRWFIEVDPDLPKARVYRVD